MRSLSAPASGLAMLAALTLSACAQPVNDSSSDGAMETSSMTEKLAPCPASPNCVCSEYPEDGHAIPPLSFAGDAGRAWSALRAAVESMPRTKIVSSDTDRLQAESRSLVFRFVDDLEFRLDSQAGEIHLRSGSRVGYSDLGANRKRVEALRERFARQLATQF